MKRTILFDNFDTDQYEEEEWNDFLWTLTHTQWGDAPCIVTGSLGLWYGRRTIVPRRFNSVHSAISEIVSVRFDFFLRVELVDGYLAVTQTHHDGTNEFEIHLLNKKGEGIKDSELLEKKTYHKRIVWE